MNRGVNLSSLAVAGVATSALAAVGRSKSSKVARNFLGGDTTSYASFDPAKELGVQDPIGFWDPLGLSAGKDEATFKRRRAVEIKHGRIVSVLACSEQQCLLKLQVRSTESVVHMMGQSYRTCIRLCDLIFRPCTQQLVTLYLSTTSSLATSLLLWD